MLLRRQLLACAELLLVGRLVLPGAEIGARRDDPRVDEAGRGRRQALDRRRGGVAELAAVAVGDGRVADVVVARGELARRALEEERRSAEGVLQHLAGGADVVGRQLPVLPREGRRVAGVVEQRRAHLALVAGDPRDEQRVVGRRIGVVAAWRSAAASRPRSPGSWPARCGRSRTSPTPRASAVARLDDRGADLLGQVLDVRLDQLDAGLVLELRVDVRPARGCATC